MVYICGIKSHITSILQLEHTSAVGSVLDFRPRVPWFKYGNHEKIKILAIILPSDFKKNELGGVLNIHEYMIKALLVGSQVQSSINFSLLGMVKLSIGANCFRTYYCNRGMRDKDTNHSRHCRI